MKDEKVVKEIAEERIARLFELAEQKTETRNPESERLAKRYMSLARRISLHYKVRMPDRIRDRTCKHCNSVLIPGVTCGVRMSRGAMLYRCNCGREKRNFLKDLPHAQSV